VGLALVSLVGGLREEKRRRRRKVQVVVRVVEKRVWKVERGMRPARNRII
jgi:hypothetical protein